MSEAPPPTSGDPSDLHTYTAYGRRWDRPLTRSERFSLWALFYMVRWAFNVRLYFVIALASAMLATCCVASGDLTWALTLACWFAAFVYMGGAAWWAKRLMDK